MSGLPELTLHVGRVMCDFFYFEERLGPASEVRNIYDTTAYLQIILSRLKTVIQRVYMLLFSSVETCTF